MLNSLEELEELALEKKDLKRNSHEELRVCI
jgi:bidirectional [NiFe] hydrogenase diaphorase subunit